MLDGLNFDVNIDPQLDMMGFDEDHQLNFDSIDINSIDIQNDLFIPSTSLSSDNSYPFHSSVSSFHAGSQSLPDSPESNQSNTQSATSMEDDDTTVGFGMVSPSPSQFTSHEFGCVLMPVSYITSRLS